MTSDAAENAENDNLFYWDTNSNFSDSDDSDFDPSKDLVSSDGSDSESDSEATTVSPPAIQMQQTAALRNNLTEDLASKVTKVLALMDGLGINLPIFLDALSWGDLECTSNAKIRYARSALLNSIELPAILRRWWRPPRPTTSKKARPKGAKPVMESFALECSLQVLELELEGLADLFKSPAGPDVTEEELVGTSFPILIAGAKKRAPNLWNLLMSLSRTSSQREQYPEKNPAKTIIVIIALFEYTRSHHRNRLQKLFAIYFKFKGLSAKGYDTLHAIGLTMSSRWTSDAVGRISDAAMEDMKRLMDIYPWLLSYDNVLIAFRVFSQRIDKKTLLGNGTACTVYIKRSAKRLPNTINRLLQEFRKDGLNAPLDAFAIFEITEISNSRRLSHTVHRVLKYLLESPDFDIASYPHRDDSAIQSPPPIFELECGPEHTTMQYLLGTVDIPEAAYDDNARLINEWLHQLGLDATPELQRKIGLEQVMVWVGDQLTVDRLRNLTRFRAEDDNSFERLDWLVSPPGWLHICMAFANSIHKQHSGSSKGRGLSAAFNVLGRKGLDKTKTQGPFFHDLNETLHIIAEAQFRELWLLVGRVSSLADLRQKTPADLYKLAQIIVSEHASSNALASNRAKKRVDELKEQSIMFLRDILPYVMLRAAIKHGDVGLMEDFIPEMLYRFVGGSNSKYQIEMLELLQGLNKEWPPELRDFIRNNCWVINNTGRREGHMPVDEAQEMNIKDIKVTHRSEGPNIDWNYLKKLHPAIHVIRSVSSHMETEFKTRVRGWRHTIPKREADIQELQKWYRASNTHKFILNRKMPDGDRPTDFVTKGMNALQTGKTLESWIEGRSIERATHQDWDSHSDDSETNNH
ncbi:hypothetical protein R3P38DRAFT_3440329 [Favolaschia claudopus]|uniref:DUF6589 domain-containing protein n=1 Tax=Favolaschia claudopus TaxID=2862362 RepID=A0AAW0CY07_9AGAR